MSQGAEASKSSPQPVRRPPPPPPPRRPARGPPFLPASSVDAVLILPVIAPSSISSVAGPSSINPPCPPAVSEYLMSDIPRGTSLPKLIKLDDELSVATIEFRHNPTWLIQDPFGFPKFTPLGTLWRAVDWNAVDEHGRTEYIRAVMKHEDGTRMSLCYAEMLAEFPDTGVNVQDDEGRTALHWACVMSDANMVMLCLSVPECQIGLKDNNGLTAFDISLQNSGGNESIPSLFYRKLFPGVALFPPIEDSNELLVEALINRGVDLTATNEYGDTALHAAAAKVDNVAITRKLLNAGSDVNAIGNRGATPLHYAVDTADAEMVKLLLLHHADRSTKDHGNRTALYLAEKDEKQDLVLLLKGATNDSSAVEDPQADLKQEAQLLRVVKKEEVQVPLSEVELRKVSKMSLPLAAQNGDLDIVRLHMRLGADLEVKSWLGQTALLHAVRSGHEVIVKLLLASGAYVDALGDVKQTTLHYAAKLGYTPVVNALLARGANIHALCEAKETPLFKAARKGHTVIVRTLLASGANMEVLSDWNETALHQAAWNGHTETVQSLLASGANVEALCVLKESPLREAVRNGNRATVKVLRAAGARRSALVRRRLPIRYSRISRDVRVVH